MNKASSVVLSGLFSTATINLNLRSTTREAVIEELVEQVPQFKSDTEAKHTLIKALHEREQLCSTGIGDGIALPHARNALVGLVDHALIVFGRRAEGIPYGAVDDLPAKLFFLLIAPTVTQHLAILARLSRLLRDPRVGQSLLVAESPEKVLAILREAEAKL
jgi:mannitol/fructose-specific phosphotransferase system IIA component (Ntr-type)